MGNFHTRGISRDRHPQYNEKNESSAQLGQASAEASVTARFAELSLDQSEAPEARDADDWELVLIDMSGGEPKFEKTELWVTGPSNHDINLCNVEGPGSVGTKREFLVSPDGCLWVEHVENARRVDGLLWKGPCGEKVSSVAHDLTAIGSWLDGEGTSN